LLLSDPACLTQLRKGKHSQIGDQLQGIHRAAATGSGIRCLGQMISSPWRTLIEQSNLVRHGGGQR
jgi:hypothetical protein